MPQDNHLSTVNDNTNRGASVHLLHSAELQFQASGEHPHVGLHHRLLGYLGVFTLSSLGTVMEIKHLLPHVLEPFYTAGWSGIAHVISGADHLMFSWGSMTALFLAAISVPAYSALKTVQTIWKIFTSKRAWRKKLQLI